MTIEMSLICPHCGAYQTEYVMSMKANYTLNCQNCDRTSPLNSWNLWAFTNIPKGKSRTIPEIEDPEIITT